MKPRTWTIIILLFLCAVLLLQNMEVVSFRVFFWDITMSRIIALPLLVLLGMIIGYIVGKLTGRDYRERKK